jgi:hypothetical protein
MQTAEGNAYRWSGAVAWSQHWSFWAIAIVVGGTWGAIEFYRDSAKNA